MKFYVKTHKDLRRLERSVTAICDENLINKKLKDKDIEIEITERFYKGDLKDTEETKEIIRTAPNLNLAGKNTIELAKKVIEIQTIKTIKGIPTAHIVCL